MGATFKPLPGEVYLQPAGSAGRPRITAEDLSGALEVTYTMPADALNALERMCCEAGQERLSEIEGNRRARRKAAAQARKGARRIDPRTVPHYPDPMLPTAGFPDAIVDAAREQRLSEWGSNSQHTMDWLRVQALHGVIIDTATPEQRAARKAACRPFYKAETGKPSRTRDADLPQVGSFHG